jgi:hypothetical protein
MINTNYLKNILLFFNNYVKKNKSLFLNDDLWISIYLNKCLNVEIESLNKFLKKRFFSGNKSIYKKHTTIDALIELYEKDRKKARNLRHQESFFEYNIVIFTQKRIKLGFSFFESLKLVDYFSFFFILKKYYKIVVDHE